MGLSLEAGQLGYTSAFLEFNRCRGQLVIRDGFLHLTPDRLLFNWIAKLGRNSWYAPEGQARPESWYQPGLDQGAADRSVGFKSSRKDSRHAMFGSLQLFRVHSEGLLVAV